MLLPEPSAATPQPRFMPGVLQNHLSASAIIDRAINPVCMLNSGTCLETDSSGPW